MQMETLWGVTANATGGLKIPAITDSTQIQSFSWIWIQHPAVEAEEKFKFHFKKMAVFRVFEMLAEGERELSDELTEKGEMQITPSKY